MKNRYYLLVGIIIFSSYLLALLSSLSSAGIFWDEPAYFEESLKNLQWLKQPAFNTIDQYWGPVQLSPPLEKYAQALSFELFHNRLQLGQIISLKLPNLLFASLTILVVYFFCLIYFNFSVAVFSSLFLVLTPRFFGHALLGSLDIPLTFLVFLFTWSVWKYKDKMPWIPGLVLGLAVLTKITALFFFVPVSLYLLIRSLTKRRRFIHTIIYLIIIVAIAIFIMFIFWPKLWLSPLARFQEFFSFFITDHNPVPFMYFGKTNIAQPWHFPWVMLGITTPVLTLFFGFIGIILPLLLKINKKKATHFLPPTSRFLPQIFYPKPLASNLSPLTSHFPPLNSYLLPLTSYLLINLLFLPVLFSLPGVAAYDAERLLLPSFPFLAIFAGIGLNFTISYLINSKILDFKFRFYILHFALCVIAILPSFIMLHHYYPYETSAYNSLIGEIKGASGAGMEPQYTLEAYKGTLDYINKNCPRNCLIYAHSNVSPYAWYQKDGLLRKDILLTDNPGDLSASYFYVLPVRKSLFYGPAAPIYENADPSFRVAIDGISLVNLYKTSTLTRYISP